MKIVTLNTWGGRAGKENLLAFFEQHKDSVDIFCLQETWQGGHEMQGAVAGGVVLNKIHPELIDDIQIRLPSHMLYFQPQFRDYFGLALFVRKEISVQETGGVYVYKEEGFESPTDFGDHSRKMQFIKIGEKENPLTVINFHGLWNGAGKVDTEERILQSENIIQFLKEQKGRIVFCGDFNLLPETQSLRMMEDFGLRNLVTEYGITSTRTSFYTKPEKFADYIFTSSNVAVKDFQVLPEEVSDHAALLVEIEEN